MVRKSISIMLLSLFSFSSADAALLTGIQGAVFLNQGEGFQPAEHSAQVAPGTRVRVENGGAEIVYDNGCAVKIGPGQTVVVLSPAPSCQQGAGAGNMFADNTLLYAGGGILIAGGVAAAVIETQSQKKPASP